MIIVVIMPQSDLNINLERFREEMLEYELRFLEQVYMKGEFPEYVEFPMEEQEALSVGFKKDGGRDCVPLKQQFLVHRIPWYTSGFE